MQIPTINLSPATHKSRFFWQYAHLLFYRDRFSSFLVLGKDDGAIGSVSKLFYALITMHFLVLSGRQSNNEGAMKADLLFFLVIGKALKSEDFNHYQTTLESSSVATEIKNKQSSSLSPRKTPATLSKHGSHFQGITLFLAICAVQREGTPSSYYPTSTERSNKKKTWI